MKTLLPCLTPGCNGALLGLSVAAAKAVLDADAAAGRSPLVRITCSRCRRISEYTREMVLKLMPPDLQDLRLAPEEFWAFIMMEIGTVESTQQRCYLGEPTLLRRVEITKDGWQATLLSPSRFAPALKVGGDLFGLSDGSFEVCTHVQEGSGFMALPLADHVPHNSDFALFFVASESHARLLTGTLFCANQSCYYPFKLTYSEWATRSAEFRRTTNARPTDHEVVTIECPRCGMARVITEQAFAGMVKT